MKLEDIIIGKTYYYKSQSTKMDRYICYECGGSGKLELKSGRYVMCDKCNGKAFIVENVECEIDKPIYPNHIVYDKGRYYLLESEIELDEQWGEVHHEIKHTMIPIEDVYEKQLNE